MTSIYKGIDKNPASFYNVFSAGRVYHFHSAFIDEAPWSRVLGAPRNAEKSGKIVITQGKARAVIEAMEKAANRKDVNGLCAPLAANFMVRLERPGVGSRTFNRAQYKEIARQSLSHLNEFHYRITIKRIVIAPGGQRATATTSAHVSGKRNGKTFARVQEQTTNLQLQSGRIVIVSATVREQPQRSRTAAKISR